MARAWTALGILTTAGPRSNFNASVDIVRERENRIGIFERAFGLQKGRSQTFGNGNPEGRGNKSAQDVL